MNYMISVIRRVTTFAVMLLELCFPLSTNDSRISYSMASQGRLQPEQR